jgi:hypothetical protein
MDIVGKDDGVAVQGPKYLVNPRSIIMLHYDIALAGEP